MGIIGKRTGTIRFDGQEIIRTSSDRIARMGIAFCPEERGIFASLDVRENLLLPPVVRRGGLSLDQIYDLFPNLKERLNSQGTKLSGGEQQMLAIARILRTGARFLCSTNRPKALRRSSSSRSATTIARAEERGFTILLVEQNFRFAATVADRYYIVEHGKVIDGFANAELHAKMDKLHTYLGRLRTCTMVRSSDLDRCRLSSASLLVGPDQRLVLRHAQPRARRHLRHAEHHQFRAWRAVHDGRVLSPVCC